MARPRTHLRPSDYDRLEAMASVGASKTTIAKRLGIAPKTLRKILNGDHRAGEAFEAGRGELESELVGALYKAATEKGNIVASIFLLKSMRGFSDQPQPQTEESRVRVELVLPQALDRASWRELVDATTPRQLEEAKE